MVRWWRTAISALSQAGWHQLRNTCSRNGHRDGATWTASAFPGFSGRNLGRLTKKFILPVTQGAVRWRRSSRERHHRRATLRDCTRYAVASFVFAPRSSGARSPSSCGARLFLLLGLRLLPTAPACNISWVRTENFQGLVFRGCCGSSSASLFPAFWGRSLGFGTPANHPHLASRRRPTGRPRAWVRLRSGVDSPREAFLRVASSPEVRAH